MLLLKTLAPWLLLVFLGQVSLSSGARNKNSGADQTSPVPGRAQRSGKPAASGRGKFSTKDKMQCTWGAKDVGDTVRLSVRCEDEEARIKGGVTLLQCEYNGRPQSCPGFRSDSKGFWKQVARAFKRLQGKVCRDDRALVKAGMCKRAPRDAHFKLDIHTSVASANSPQRPHHPPPPPTTTTTTTTTTPSPRSVSTSAPPNATACTKRADHRKTAEEKCSGAWASVCNFFLSMLQSEDC